MEVSNWLLLRMLGSEFLHSKAYMIYINKNSSDESFHRWTLTLWEQGNEEVLLERETQTNVQIETKV